MRRDTMSRNVFNYTLGMQDNDALCKRNALLGERPLISVSKDREKSSRRMVLRKKGGGVRRGGKDTGDGSECQDTERPTVALCFILQHLSFLSFFSLPFVFSSSPPFSLSFSRVRFSPLLAGTRIIDECYTADFRFAHNHMQAARYMIFANGVDFRRGKLCV